MLTSSTSTRNPWPFSGQRRIARFIQASTTGQCPIVISVMQGQRSAIGAPVRHQTCGGKSSPRDWLSSQRYLRNASGFGGRRSSPTYLGTSAQLVRTRPEKMDIEEIDVACTIVATGFRPESNAGLGVESGGYWRPLGQPSGAINILGDGDGALNEVLRHVVGDGVTTLVELAKGGDGTNNSGEELRAQLRRLDMQHRATIGTSTLNDLRGSRFGALDEVIIKRADENGGAKARPVRLLTSMHPFKTTSFLLNRFLVARLIHNDRVEWLPRALPRSAQDLAAMDGTGYYRVGPKDRVKTKLVTPTLDHRDLSDVIQKSKLASIGGGVQDLIDITRHAWWREGHDPKLKRDEQPRPNPEGLGVTLARCVSKVKGTPYPAQAWPLEDGDPAARDRVAIACQALLQASKDQNSWAGNGDWVSLDAVALMADLEPRHAAVCLARAGDGCAGGELAFHHDNSVVVNKCHGDAGGPKLLEEHVQIAKSIVNSPRLPDAIKRRPDVCCRSENARQVAWGYLYARED